MPGGSDAANCGPWRLLLGIRFEARRCLWFPGRFSACAGGGRRSLRAGLAGAGDHGPQRAAPRRWCDHGGGVGVAQVSVISLLPQ